MLRPIYEKLRKLWYKLVTLKSSPRKIALGFAVGIFLSYTPTFGVQTVLAVGLATMLRVNPISTVVGVYLTNVFTAWPIYAMCYKVGSWIVGSGPLVGPPDPDPAAGWGFFAHISKLGVKWIALELLGAVVVGTVSAVPAYFLTLFAVIKYRTVRLNRRIKRIRARISQPQKGGPEHPEAPPRSSPDAPA